MLATVVVGDLRPAGEQRGDLFETRLRHAHGGQGEGTAEGLDIEQRTEAGQGAVVEQVVEAAQDVFLAAIQLGGEQRVGMRLQRQAVLQAVQQAPVELIHGGAPGRPAARCSGRRTACRRAG